MSKEAKPSPSMSYDDESDDGGGVQLHGVLKLKNVLYYKKHSRKAVPTKGTLKLSQETLSFRSKGLDYTWDLPSIRAEKFKGRVNGGMKLYGKRKNGPGDDEVEEYTFTMVKQRSYDIICNAIEEAKFESDLKKVRLASMEAVSDAGEDNLRKSLIAGDGREVKTKRHLLPKPLRIIVLGFFQVISFIYKIFTGRRLGGPKNIHHALHRVLRKVNPILTVSKLALSKRTVMAIKKDVDGIHDSLMTIRRVTQRQQSAFLSSGTVAESVNESDSIIERSGLPKVWDYAIQYISFFLFTIRRLLNLPNYRWNLVEINQQPSSVDGAVKQANDELEALMELAVTQKLPPEVKSTILGETKKIQILLYNIKVHAKGEMKQPSTKEE